VSFGVSRQVSQVHVVIAPSEQGVPDRLKDTLFRLTEAVRGDKFESLAKGRRAIVKFVITDRRFPATAA
jgi:hypothetical protein